MTATCAYPSTSNNHSDDLVIVHHGCPEPVTLCGFHASWSMNRVMDAVRTSGNHDCQRNFAALASSSPAIASS